MPVTGRRTTVQVTRPLHLAAVQIATRQMCRGIAFSEHDVFGAVIGVSELAHSLLVETPRCGEVSFRTRKVRGGYALEVQVTRLKGGPHEPGSTKSVTFRPEYPFQTGSDARH